MNPMLREILIVMAGDLSFCLICLLIFLSAAWISEQFTDDPEPGNQKMREVMAQPDDPGEWPDPRDPHKTIMYGHAFQPSKQWPDNCAICSLSEANHKPGQPQPENKPQKIGCHSFVGQAGNQDNCLACGFPKNAICHFE
jgi:hypothetical protein